VFNARFSIAQQIRAKGGAMTNSFVVTYFSMEVGLEPEMPTYSGGLGILAGDTLRATAEAI